MLDNLNFGIEGKLNTSNYASNFFGFGNETDNLNAEDDDNFDLDYNRVKIKTIGVKPSLIWRGQLGAKLQVGALYESKKVDNTLGRFITTLFNDSAFFDTQDFYGVDATYYFENKDNLAFPTLGFQVGLQTGYKLSLIHI